jgi:hypothetical protein
MRLAVEHPTCLLPREAERQFTQQRHKPMLFFFHALTVAVKEESERSVFKCSSRAVQNSLDDFVPFALLNAQDQAINDWN